MLVAPTVGLDGDGQRTSTRAGVWTTGTGPLFGGRMGVASDEERIRQFAEIIGVSTLALCDALLVEECYHERHVPKPNGTVRTIVTPVPVLKHVQRAIHEILLEQYNVVRRFENLEHVVHGFVPERSAVSNARVHAGHTEFFMCDLLGAFDQVTEARVRQIAEDHGFGPWAELLVDLSTHHGSIPMGAPSSPVLLNLALLKFDQAMVELMNDTTGSVAYTRYADDLCLSATDPRVLEQFVVGMLVELREFDFKLNPKKIRHLRARQGAVRITGLAVHPYRSPNDVAVPRRKLRQVRAMLHRALKGQVSHQHVIGMMSYVRMVMGDTPLPEWLRVPLRKYARKHPLPPRLWTWAKPL